MRSSGASNKPWSATCSRPVSRSASPWTTSIGQHPIQLDRRQLQHVFTLQFLERKEHVLVVGPVGVAKTFVVQALGTAAVRAGKSVLFLRADELLRELGQARADYTFEQVFRRYLTPDLLILDDFGLRRLNAQQSTDLYELIIARHRHSSF